MRNSTGVSANSSMLTKPIKKPEPTTAKRIREHSVEFAACAQHRWGWAIQTPLPLPHSSCYRKSDVVRCSAISPLAGFGFVHL